MKRIEKEVVTEIFFFLDNYSQNTFDVNMLTKDTK